MKIAYLGTMGIPAHYGGFETCVEEVSTRLAKQGHEIIVYCGYRGPKPKIRTYRNVTLVFIPSLNKIFGLYPSSFLAKSIEHAIFLFISDKTCIF